VSRPNIGAIAGDPQAVAGSRGRAACARLLGAGADLATALRKAIPFLARRRIGVTAELPACASFAELQVDLTIVHTAPFSIGPPPLHGLVMVDEAAMARILDGVLGGDGAPSVGLCALTSAQTALANRVSAALVRSFGDVLASKFALAVEPAPGVEVKTGTAVLTTLTLEGGGRILIAIPLAVIGPESAGEEPDVMNPQIAAALGEVELDIVAELGTLRLSLATIANLQVGDVLRLPLALDERVRVRAGGSTIFRGRPTAQGDIVAIALDRRVA
jgi:flagellar motor switch protein FliM